MNDNGKQFKQVIAALDAAKSIVILNPRKPDGDSVGSALALMWALEQRAKKATPFALGEVPTQYQFLPGNERFISDLAKVNWANTDVLVTVDFADPAMSGLEEQMKAHAAAGKPVIVIDHHATNQGFGTMNLIDPTVASTTELIYELFQSAKWPITKDMATNLLLGIITDTNSFSNLNTTGSVIHVASQLLNYGARLKEITLSTYKNKTYPGLKLWGLALSRLQKHPSLDIAWTVITQKDIEQFGATDESIDGIANFLNGLSGAKAVLVLREEPGGELKGSLRTTQPDVDVSKIAQLFGGGGHKKAAGFSLPGRLELQAGGGWKVV